MMSYQTFHSPPRLESLASKIPRSSQKNSTQKNSTHKFLKNSTKYKLYFAVINFVHINRRVSDGKTKLQQLQTLWPTNCEL